MEENVASWSDNAGTGHSISPGDRSEAVWDLGLRFGGGNEAISDALGAHTAWHARLSAFCVHQLSRLNGRTDHETRARQARQCGIVAESKDHGAPRSPNGSAERGPKRTRASFVTSRPGRATDLVTPVGSDVTAA